MRRAILKLLICALALGFSAPSQAAKDNEAEALARLIAHVAEQARVQAAQARARAEQRALEMQLAQEAQVREQAEARARLVHQRALEIQRDVDLIFGEADKKFKKQFGYNFREQASREEEQDSGYPRKRPPDNARAASKDRLIKRIAHGINARMRRQAQLREHYEDVRENAECRAEDALEEQEYQDMKRGWATDEDPSNSDREPQVNEAQRGRGIEEEKCQQEGTCSTDRCRKLEVDLQKSTKQDFFQNTQPPNLTRGSTEHIVTALGRDPRWKDFVKFHSAHYLIDQLRGGALQKNIKDLCIEYYHDDAAKQIQCIEDLQKEFGVRGEPGLH